jgi:hypothetical protein
VLFDFLKRFWGGRTESEPLPVPEEVPAQEYDLRLTYHAKASAGVRMAAGAAALTHLPGLVQPVAKGPVEVVEPLPVELAEASPQLVRPEVALPWLEAHGRLSPVARHAVHVLESVGAVDLAYDTLAVGLLNGEVDTAGYPEFNAIVGGLASHWDEATGDLIVRGIVGWGGRGVRGDTDRAAQRLLANIVSNLMASQYAVEMTVLEKPLPAPAAGGVVCASCGFASADEGAFYCPRCGVRLLRG